MNKSSRRFALLALLSGALSLPGVASAVPPGPKVPAFTTVVASVSGQDSPQRIITYDINKDGKTDILSAGYAAGNLHTFLATGTGDFTMTTTLTGNLFGMDIADLNGDGNIDVVTTGYAATQV